MEQGVGSGFSAGWILEIFPASRRESSSQPQCDGISNNRAHDIDVLKTCSNLDQSIFNDSEPSLQTLLKSKHPENRREGNEQLITWLGTNIDLNSSTLLYSCHKSQRQVTLL